MVFYSGEWSQTQEKTSSTQGKFNCPECSFMFLNLPFCSSTFLFVPQRSFWFLNVPFCSSTFLFVPQRSSLSPRNGINGLWSISSKHDVNQTLLHSKILSFFSITMKTNHHKIVRSQLEIVLTNGNPFSQCQRMSTERWNTSGNFKKSGQICISIHRKRLEMTFRDQPNWLVYISYGRGARNSWRRCHRVFSVTRHLNWLSIITKWYAYQPWMGTINYVHSCALS